MRGCSIMRFPDGEVQVKLDELNRKDTVAIRCRITTSEHLFILMQLADIIARQCVVVERMDIFYLMSMRSDRLFSLDRPFSLKIVADVVNSFNAKKVVILEPHSDRSLDLIRNSCAKYMDFVGSWPKPKTPSDLIKLICFPDDGAYKRYKESEYATRHHYIVCEKKRNVDTGELNGFKIKKTSASIGPGFPIYVIDDLCDGGGTFCGIYEELKAHFSSPISLCVTHAIQKAGIERVAHLYDHVYITNSFYDWRKESLPDNVTVVDVFEVK